MKVFRADKINETILTLQPRIPINLYKGEDSITKRICCSTSINGCLSSVDDFEYGDIVYLYEADVKEFYQPTPQQVVDVYLTAELWLFNTTSFKQIGKIGIIGWIGQSIFDVINNQYAFSIKG